MRAASTALRRRLGDERGIALLVALGCLLALAVAVTAVIQYTTANQASTNLAAAEAAAAQTSEQGVMGAYSILNAPGHNAADPTLLSVPRCVAVGSHCPRPGLPLAAAGTATVAGSFVLATSTWTITSTGYAVDPSTGGLISHTLRATTTVQQGAGPASLQVWNHLYATAPQGSGCEIDITNPSVFIDVPVYTAGDVCLEQTNDRIHEAGAGGQAVDVNIGGKLVLSGAFSSVGDSATFPITSGTVAGGCSTSLSGPASPCGPATRFWVRGPSTAPQLTPPQDASDYWYAHADLGPGHSCAGPLPPGLVFDNDTVKNGSVSAPFNLTPSSSYTCVSTGGTGRLSWNNVTKQLTVAGTIYIDGNVQVTQTASYTGVATLYVGGSFSFVGSGVTLCAVPLCLFGTWNPNTRMLMIVAEGSGNAVNISGDFDGFQGGVYANQNATTSFNGSFAFFQGPLVSGKFAFGSSVILHPLPLITSVPAGTPPVPAHLTPLNYLNG